MDTPFEVTKNEIRYRVKSPRKFSKKSFRRKRISRGVSLVVGCPKGEYSSRIKRCKVGTQVQAVRFDRDYFTTKKARKWIEKHKRGKRLQ